MTSNQTRYLTAPPPTTQNPTPPPTGSLRWDAVLQKMANLCAIISIFLPLVLPAASSPGEVTVNTTTNTTTNNYYYYFDAPCPEPEEHDPPSSVPDPDGSVARR
ncbi:hypothetical protein EQW78_17610 [Oerskovia turbata]|uniref:Uncharacterized protein n=1 Tax=Oerskovia turbata TaxID=1713 RepID=A0A4V1N3T0_9CELL|nr:hypothetical protein [Oerskovia turbata]RXR21727.1 hypothetical protein EQW73_17700 [Oerskovia turbata]RXR29736.1 hypothetical protein EQW78_17610 [Oerskovia turbata]